MSENYKPNKDELKHRLKDDVESFDNLCNQFIKRYDNKSSSI